MKHARVDYQRIQDPAGLIPENEPVFLIRAKDVTGPDTVRAWARLQYQNGGNREMAGLAMQHAETMEAWQRAHGSQVADMPGAKQSPGNSPGHPNEDAAAGPEGTPAAQREK